MPELQQQQQQQQQAIFVPEAMLLPENREWINRFEIRSRSSNRIYVVAQHKTRRSWGCSCPGWRRYRRCAHLESLGLPSSERPYEINVVASSSVYDVRLDHYTPPALNDASAERKIMFEEE